MSNPPPKRTTTVSDIAKQRETSLDEREAELNQWEERLQQQQMDLDRFESRLNEQVSKLLVLQRQQRDILGLAAGRTATTDGKSKVGKVSPAQAKPSAVAAAIRVVDTTQAAVVQRKAPGVPALNLAKKPAGGRAGGVSPRERVVQEIAASTGVSPGGRSISPSKYNEGRVEVNANIVPSYVEELSTESDQSGTRTPRRGVAASAQFTPVAPEDALEFDPNAPPDDADAVDLTRVVEYLLAQGFITREDLDEIVDPMELYERFRYLFEGDEEEEEYAENCAYEEDDVGTARRGRAAGTTHGFDDSEEYEEGEENVVYEQGGF
jgi:hypothetical protein